MTRKWKFALANYANAKGILYGLPQSGKFGSFFDPKVQNFRVQRSIGFSEYGHDDKGAGNGIPRTFPTVPLVLPLVLLPAVDLQAAEDDGRGDAAEDEPEEQEKQFAHSRSPPFARWFALIFAANGDRLCVPT